MTFVAESQGSSGLWRALAVIAATAFLFVLPMLIWGYAPTHDFTFHVGNWMEVAHQWQQGILLPRWASHANYGFGEPRFIFYPPLGGMAGAAVSALMPWRAVPGAFVFCTLIVAGTCMFLMAREWVPERFALLAALAYVINPYEVMLVYKRMAAAEMLAAAVFPFFLLHAFRIADGQRRSMVPLAGVYALIWLTNAPSAVMASYSVALLLTVMAVRKRTLAPIVYGGAALALGIGLAAFYIVPAAWEQRWVDISLALTLPHNRPENNFIRLFPPRLPGGIGSIITVGVVNLVLGATVCLMAYRRRRSLFANWWLFALLAVFAAVFTLPASSLLWHTLPKMIFVQLPWRWLFIVNTACALMFGALLATAQERKRTLVAAIPALLFLVLLGAYATKGKPGQVEGLQGRMQREGGVWAEAQYLPRGGVRGPGLANGALVRHPDMTPADVRFVRRDAEVLIFDVDQAHAGKLLLDVASYPAWTAKVNSTEATVENVQGQIGLAVPAGLNTVEVKFRQTRDRTLGGIASIVALAVSVLAWVFTGKRERGALPRRKTFEKQQA